VVYACVCVININNRNVNTTQTENRHREANKYKYIHTQHEHTHNTHITHIQTNKQKPITLIFFEIVSLLHDFYVVQSLFLCPFPIFSMLLPVALAIHTCTYIHTHTHTYIHAISNYPYANSTTTNYHKMTEY